MNNVHRVLQAKTYYERLDLPVAIADDKLVKRQYKKLALLVHPDKIHQESSVSHEKATEAFKLLTQAFDVLRDKSQQQSYYQRVKPKVKEPLYEKYKPNFSFPDKGSEYVYNNRPPQWKAPQRGSSRANKESPKKRKKPERNTHQWTYKYEEWTPEQDKKRKTDSQQTGTHSPPAEEVKPKMRGISCTICKRTFPNEDVLQKHQMFAQFNHKFPNKSKEEPQKGMDPSDPIFVND